MPTLRDTIAKTFLRGEVAKLREATAEFTNGARRLARVQSGLQEVDGRTSNALSRGLRPLFIDTSSGAITEAERWQMVQDCRLLYTWEVLTKAMIRLWGNYGFGQNIEIVCRDPKANAVWIEFWEAQRNRPVIGPRRRRLLSDRLLVDGEFFLVAFTDTDTGLTTVRTVRTEAVSEIVTEAEDIDIHVWYKREYVPSGEIASKTMYYRDWQVLSEGGDDKRLLPDDAELAHKQKTGTDVCMMQIGMPALGSRGLPLLMGANDWIRELRDFMQNRLALNRMVGLMAQEAITAGGSRMVDAIKTFFDSALAMGSDDETNPAPPVGSVFAHNKAVDTKRNPLSTGAGDAETDAQLIYSLVGLAGGVFPHYLGMGQAFRLATSTSMEEPIRRQWIEYRGFWASVWRDLVNLVLDQYTAATGEKFEERAIDVNTDALLEKDLSVFTAALEKVFNLGFVDKATATRLTLGAFNVPASDEMAEEPEAPQPEKAAPEQQEAPMPESDWSRVAMLEAAARIVARDGDLEGLFERMEEGGKGSGNWGHIGVKGSQGGSAPTTGPTARSDAGGYGPAMSLDKGKTAGGRQAFLKATGIPYDRGLASANAAIESGDAGQADAVIGKLMAAGKEKVAAYEKAKQEERAAYDERLKVMRKGLPESKETTERKPLEDRAEAAAKKADRIAKEIEPISQAIEHMRGTLVKQKTAAQMTRGKEMDSKYPGVCRVSGDRFRAGERIYYRDGKAALKSATDDWASKWTREAGALLQRIETAE